MLSRYKADFVAKIEALEKACEVANHGLKPTKDANGRLHAPCAGYIFNDSIYGAGEYLSDDGMRQHANYSAKVKVKVESLSIIAQVWPASNGAKWVENGESVTYAYLNGLTKTQKEDIEAAFPSNRQKTLVLESEALANGLQTGKAFKLSMRGIAHAWATDSGNGHYFECYLADSGLAPLLKMEVKANKMKFDHPYKGQMVAYHYTFPQAL
jgi:hypothetical protein